MVDYHSLRHFDNFLMQVYQGYSFPFAPSHLSYRVEIACSLLCKPFVFSQPLVISRVHLCVSGLCHPNPPERIPVAYPPIQKHWPNDYAFKPIEDVNACFDLPPPPVEILSTKHDNSGAFAGCLLPRAAREIWSNIEFQMTKIQNRPDVPAGLEHLRLRISDLFSPHISWVLWKCDLTFYYLRDYVYSRKLHTVVCGKLAKIMSNVVSSLIKTT